MASASTVTGIKNQVTGGDKEGVLYLGEVQGEMWASNRFWQAPASRVVPLLEKFNVDPGKPGAYHVNGSVRLMDVPADISAGMAKMLELSAYTVPLVPLTLTRKQAYVYSGTCYLAVHLAGDGSTLGLRSDTLDWLTATHDLERVTDEQASVRGAYYANVRLVAGKSREKFRSVAVVADVLTTVEPGRHEQDDLGKTVWVEPVTQLLATRVIGAMVAGNLDG